MLHILNVHITIDTRNNVCSLFTQAMIFASPEQIVVPLCSHYTVFIVWLFTVKRR